MRQDAPFQADDLESLDELYRQAFAVMPMRDVYRGQLAHSRIAVRHDVDDNAGSWRAAIEMARWEFDRGYHTTYFLLHSASYWGQRYFWDDVRNVAAMGHEIGIHVNAIASAIRTRDKPGRILGLALDELRHLTGLEIIGSVAHGDELCREFHFVNDEQFTDCARPDYGAPDRQVGPIKLDPRPLSDFGLRYDSNRLPRKFYASDSGGTWNQPWEQTVEQGLSPEGQLHLLIHPDWWTEAF